MMLLDKPVDERKYSIGLNREHFFEITIRGIDSVWMRSIQLTSKVLPNRRNCSMKYCKLMFNRFRLCFVSSCPPIHIIIIVWKKNDDFTQVYGEHLLLFLLFVWLAKHKSILIWNFDTFQNRYKSINIHERIIERNRSYANHISTKIQLQKWDRWFDVGKIVRVNLHRHLIFPMIEILDAHPHRGHGVIIVLLVVLGHRVLEFQSWNDWPTLANQTHCLSEEK